MGIWGVALKFESTVAWENRDDEQRQVGLKPKNIIGSDFIDTPLCEKMDPIGVG